ncbi:MAG: AmmeMemoRadiSam system protein B [Elusimicrobiota bacterium]|nr:AmmeMemoRadiSam system protein B [Elusimicrobiota bacterium]
MRKTLFLFAGAALIVFGCGARLEKKIRKAAYKGSWYPADKAAVLNRLERYADVGISTGGVSVSPPFNGTVIGIVLPHAGWVYAESVAAEAVKLLKGKAFSDVILVGPSHKEGLDGIALDDSESWETPFGLRPVNTEIGNQINVLKQASFDGKIHKKEHSLEVVLPYLEAALEDFSLTPVLVGQSFDDSGALARRMAALYKEGMLFAASSDMSHYLTYDQANAMDSRCLDYMANFDDGGLQTALQSGEVQLCGASAVLAVMEASRLAGANAVRVLKYANSGDTTGDKSRVVGYAAVCFYKKGVGMLNKDEKKSLLKIARKTVELYAKKRIVPEVNPIQERLKEVQGAFVTLKKDGMLRGCIGNIVGAKPLWETVRDMAVEASSRDPRFPPVTKNELRGVKIEISVLTPPQKVMPDDIVLGRDGVIVRRGTRQGVYLPQVAEETGWSKEEFMNSLCAHKAGLNEEAWKEDDTDIFTFQADVFSE